MPPLRRRRPRVLPPVQFADAAPPALHFELPQTAAPATSAGSSTTNARPPERPVTAREVAEFYKVAPLTIRRMLGRGLPFFRVGAQLRFRLSEVDAFFGRQSPSREKK